MPGSNIVVRDLKVDEKQSVTKHMNCAAMCCMCLHAYICLQI